MALESDDHRNTLHNLGKDSINKISKGHSIFGDPNFRYRTTPKQNETPPVIPNESVFTEADDEKAAVTTEKRLPTVADCASHLELLECFYVLRQKVLRTEELDTAFGIEPNYETKTGKDGKTKKLKDKTLWDRRQVKWPKYIEIAVVRFILWRNACSQEWSPFRVPPLDVLMVWHAFLLNPRLFREHCGSAMLYRVCFPWHIIHDCIDNNEWKFTLPDRASETFQAKTGLIGDLFGQLSKWKDEKKAAGKTELSESWATLELQQEMPIPNWVHDLSSDSQMPKHFKALNMIDINLAIQLRDAVIRQGSFVEKMSNLMWIRSPALIGTLARAIDRYAKFLHLMKLYPKQMLVPTLDIDLAWHTHQCSALAYLIGSKERAGRFINHDDTIVEKKLTNGFSKTLQLFRVHFGKDYKVCGCWDCEVLLSAMEDVIEVKKNSGMMPDMAAVVKQVEMDVMYHRAVEVARRKKKPLPYRDD